MCTWAQWTSVRSSRVGGRLASMQPPSLRGASGSEWNASMSSTLRWRNRHTAGHSSCSEPQLAKSESLRRACSSKGSWRAGCTRAGTPVRAASAPYMQGPWVLGRAVASAAGSSAAGPQCGCSLPASSPAGHLAGKQGEQRALHPLGAGAGGGGVDSRKLHVLCCWLCAARPLQHTLFALQEAQVPHRNPARVQGAPPVSADGLQPHLRWQRRALWVEVCLPETRSRPCARTGINLPDRAAPEHGLVRRFLAAAPRGGWPSRICPLACRFTSCSRKWANRHRFVGTGFHPAEGTFILWDGNFQDSCCAC